MRQYVPSHRSDNNHNLMFPALQKEDSLLLAALDDRGIRISIQDYVD
jgi:hypothetical protein